MHICVWAHSASCSSVSGMSITGCTQAVPLHYWRHFFAACATRTLNFSPYGFTPIREAVPCVQQPHTDFLFTTSPGQVGKAKPTGFSRPCSPSVCLSVYFNVGLFRVTFIEFLLHLFLSDSLSLWLFFSLTHQTHCIITSFSTTSWCHQRAVGRVSSTQSHCCLSSCFLLSSSTFLDPIWTTSLLFPLMDLGHVY